MLRYNSYKAIVTFMETAFSFPEFYFSSLEAYEVQPGYATG